MYRTLHSYLPPTSERCLRSAATNIKLWVHYTRRKLRCKPLFIYRVNKIIFTFVSGLPPTETVISVEDCWELPGFRMPWNLTYGLEISPFIGAWSPSHWNKNCNECEAIWDTRNFFSNFETKRNTAYWNRKGQKRKCRMIIEGNTTRTGVP